MTGAEFLLLAVGLWLAVGIPWLNRRMAPPAMPTPDPSRDREGREERRAAVFFDAEGRN